MNTVRIFAAEGMRVAHLGDLGAMPTPRADAAAAGARYDDPVGGITQSAGHAYYLRNCSRGHHPDAFQAPGNHRLRAPEDFTGF
ncbi:MAG: hypothetical protein ACLU0Z_06715 [Oscillospiraceae bacterium]